MLYIFVFLGEFGYELLNWQGTIRRFSKTIGTEDRIICCSRASLQPFYETADGYVDISNVELYRQSVACGYYALPPEDPSLTSRVSLDFDCRLKQALQRFILDHIRRSGDITLPNSWWRSLLTAFQRVRFIFSSECTEIHDCRFGANRDGFGSGPAQGNIYDQLDLENNKFRRIEAPLIARQSIENRLGWDLGKPFVLCQTRRRRITIRSEQVIPTHRLIDRLSERMQVVLLSFETGRYLDSSSNFKAAENCSLFHCSSFDEQACLIHFAKCCVFFTEGDFGSHIYLPPFLGRDVYAIAPAEIYNLGTTPIEFWNKNVFRFGGQILARTTDEVFVSEEYLTRAVNEILA